MSFKYLQIFLLIFILNFLIISCKESSTEENKDDKVIYKNANYTIEERANDLLARMTLAEKIGQMTQAGRSFLQDEADIRNYFLGSVLSGGGSSPSPNAPFAWAEMYRASRNDNSPSRLTDIR